MDEEGGPISNIFPVAVMLNLNQVATLVVAIATTRDCSGVAHFCGHIRELSWRVADVGAERGSLLHHRALSEVVSLFLGADISDN